MWAKEPELALDSKERRVAHIRIISLYGFPSQEVNDVTFKLECGADPARLHRDDGIRKAWSLSITSLVGRRWQDRKI